jgi:hypothetical protein
MRALFLIMIAGGVASAYPQFQLTTGAKRCNQCHYAPAGGGEINPYGRDESADTISTGGNGDFLFGAVKLPRWLMLGGDVRVAGLVDDEGATSGTELAAFPMQADLYADIHGGPWFVQLAIGAGGAARAGQVTEEVLSFLNSREHWVMYRPKPAGWYIRAGRFFAPFGLRLPEHDTYIRNYLGFGAMEETYGVSFGVVKNEWELHLTAFTFDPWQNVRWHDSGGAAYYEKRLGDGEKATVGLEAKVAAGADDLRITGGATAKYFLSGAKLLFMAEGDYLNQKLAGFDQSGFVGYLGAAKILHQGLWARAAIERYDEDLAVKDVARDAASLMLQWFPKAHFEVMLYGKYQWIPGGSPQELGMLQLHYYP